MLFVCKWIEPFTDEQDICEPGSPTSYEIDLPVTSPDMAK